MSGITGHAPHGKHLDSPVPKAGGLLVPEALADTPHEEHLKELLRIINNRYAVHDLPRPSRDLVEQLTQMVNTDDRHDRFALWPHKELLIRPGLTRDARCGAGIRNGNNIAERAILLDLDIVDWCVDADDWEEDCHEGLQLTIGKAAMIG